MATHGHHYCGGTLVDSEVTWEVDARAFTLPGYKCLLCHEEQISALQMDLLERAIAQAQGPKTSA